MDEMTGNGEGQAGIALMAPAEKVVQTNKYSQRQLNSYDSTRHIEVDEAYKLIRDQDDRNLDVSKLIDAVNRQEIHTYIYKGKQYLDRHDIGRMYHNQPDEKRGLTVERYFSIKGEDPLKSVGEYTNVDLVLKDIEGNIIFSMEDAEFPEKWIKRGLTDAKIVASKYFHRPDKPDWKDKLKTKTGRDHEYSLKHLVTRVSNFFADKGEEFGYFKTQEDKEAFRDELMYLQINGMFAFNSPVYFNAGLFNEYGIKGSRATNYVRNIETGEVTKFDDGCYVHPQCHACFINSIGDDLESILMTGVHEGSVFSLGSGVGENAGTMRSEGEKLSSGGQASGPMSFVEILDTIAGCIKSGGKSRRAARMQTMGYNHPDILKFITAKTNEERKALTLIQDGYSGGMDGEAATTISFQNTNFSIRLDDYFFKQIKSNGTIDLINVNDGKVVQSVSAREILKDIAYGSWRSGDPGVQYDSMIQKMHTAPNSGRQNSTNPCSEYMFLDDTSCNLGSHNLLAYTDKKGNFDVEEFRRAVRIAHFALDIANDAASYPIQKIAETSPEFSTTGMGFANLGAFFMRRGIPYDSDEARSLGSAITALMTGTAYEASTEIAEARGAFMHYEFNRRPMLKVMETHRKSLDDILGENVPKDIKTAAIKSWDNVISRGQDHGFANAQNSVLAPTGTISFLMNCDTTGMEPGYQLMTFKSLAGGGGIPIVLHEATNALENLGYSKDQIENIQQYILENKKVHGAPGMRPEHYNIFDTALGDEKGTGELSFDGHVKMMAALQPFISGGISKTVNMPEHTTVKTFYDTYQLGHELGLKSISVYRDGSKLTAVYGDPNKDYSQPSWGEKKELPSGRQAWEWELQVGGTDMHFMVSEYQNGTPGQIVFLCLKEGSSLGATLKSNGVLASKGLRTGMSLESVISAWEGQAFAPSGLVLNHPYIKTAKSPLDAAAKILALEYLGDISIANDPTIVDIKKLRGNNNGAFMTYARKNFNEWDKDHVMNDPITGGFNGKKAEDIVKDYLKRKLTDLNLANVIDGVDLSSNNGQDKKKESSKVKCDDCGSVMHREGSSGNCYQCDSCGKKRGGCGA